VCVSVASAIRICRHNDVHTPVANTAPLGIDKTWFDKPDVAPHRADCTRTGCDCGNYYREFKHGLTQAVADALYLDGSWHRLDATVSQMKLSTHDRAEYDDLRKERNEAVCNILMSQKTLRLYGEYVLKQLRTQKRQAEKLGLDNRADCDAGDLSICEHTDNIDLYHRIMYDLQALSNTARVTNTNLENNKTAKSE